MDVKSKSESERKLRKDQRETKSETLKELIIIIIIILIMMMMLMMMMVMMMTIIIILIRRRRKRKPEQASDMLVLKKLVDALRPRTVIDSQLNGCAKRVNCKL